MGDGWTNTIDVGLELGLEVTPVSGVCRLNKLARPPIGDGVEGAEHRVVQVCLLWNYHLILLWKIWKIFSYPLID